MTDPVSNWGRAPGYWGRSPFRRFSCELVANKILRMNLDKIRTLSQPYALWQEASNVQSGLSACSCYKTTAKQPDIPCSTCYGTGKIPGYFKFGTRNYWVASVDAGWTLTNLSLDTDNRPNRFKLSDGQLTGTAVSPNLTISITSKAGVWESRADGFVRDMDPTKSSVTVTASKDNGATWFALSQLETQAPTTQLKFKVTIVRTTTSVKSPMFEIVRARFPVATDLMNVVNEPVVRLIAAWERGAEYREKYGEKIEAPGKRFWTMPLTMFDSTLSINTPAARIFDDSFIEVRYGGLIGVRYSIIELAYSDTLGIFTRQEFGIRRIVGSPGSTVGEIYYRIM